jgi:lipopolysaccharide assembly outer membrane protein LptD (OstA)
VRRIESSLALLVFAVAALTGVHSPASAQSKIAGFEFRFQELDYNNKSGNFTTPKRFRAIRGGTEIEGDKASGNATLKSFVATGNVVVHQKRNLSGGLTEITRLPSTLTCDRLEVDGPKRAYTAIGTIHYTQPSIVAGLDRDITADKGVFSEGDDKLHLQGNVHIHEGKTTIVSSVVDYNVATGDFSTPARFTAIREGTQIEGDKGTGNAHSLDFAALGNVVVTQTQPLQGRGDISRLTEQPSTLTTDKLSVDGLKRRYVADGNVHFSQLDRDATAQHGRLDDASHVLHMNGKVKIKDGDRRLDADVVDYDIQSGDLHASGNVIARGPAAEFAHPAASAGATPSKKKK